MDIQFDFQSYIIGYNQGVMDGKGHVIFDETTTYTFTDSSNNGNIVIAAAAE